MYRARYLASRVLIGEATADGAATVKVEANADLSAWLRASAAECREAAATVGRVEADLLMKRATRYEILAEDVESRGARPYR